MRRQCTPKNIATTSHRAAAEVASGAWRGVDPPKMLEPRYLDRTATRSCQHPDNGHWKKRVQRPVLSG